MIKDFANSISLFIENEKRKAATRHILQKAEPDDIMLRKFIAVLAFLHGYHKWPDEESNALRLVNEIRDEFLVSRQTITMTDYGAGSSGSHLSREEMAKGVRKEVSISGICKKASTPPDWGELMFRIIREFKPGHCLELGTCLGISGAYQLSAIKLNGYGQLTTVEGDAEFAGYAEGALKKIHCPEYSVHVGRFLDVLPEILSKENPVDFAFIDGHHDKEATQEYYELIYPYLVTRAVVIFDDINWSDGMREAWRSICTEGKGIRRSFDLRKWGICLIDKEWMGPSKGCRKINPWPGREATT